MKTCANALLILALWAASAGLGQAATITWTNTAGGNWSQADNWDPNQVPTAGDDAFIPADGTYTVTNDVAVSVNSLNVGGNSGVQTLYIPGTTLTIGSSATFDNLGSLSFNGGTIEGAGSIDLSGTNYWYSGTIENSGLITIVAGGVLQINSGNDHWFPGTTWNNQGTILWTGGNLRGGGTVITNANLWLDETSFEIDNGSNTYE